MVLLKNLFLAAFLITSCLFFGTADGVPIKSCFLDPDPGPCYGYFIHYYYNSSKGRCEEFIYGNCGGNANNFPTMKECRAACERS